MTVIQNILRDVTQFMLKFESYTETPEANKELEEMTEKIIAHYDRHPYAVEVFTKAKEQVKKRYQATVNILEKQREIDTDLLALYRYYEDKVLDDDAWEELWQYSDKIAANSPYKGNAFLEEYYLERLISVMFRLDEDAKALRKTETKTV